MADLQAVYLDWSGTLARPRTKAAFLRGDAHDVLYSDALPSVRALQAAGLRVGVIANTSAPHAAFVAALEREGFHFSASVISAGSSACPWRKPDPRPFLAALTADGLLPQQALMVGNNPRTDVAGAHAAGMPAMLLVRRGATDNTALWHAAQTLVALRNMPALCASTL